MEISTYTINIILLSFLSLFIFFPALYFGLEMHIKAFPNKPKWIYTSNVIFSLSMAVWIDYWAIHYNNLLSPDAPMVYKSPLVYLVGFVFALPYFVWQAAFETTKLVSRKTKDNCEEILKNDNSIITNYCPICGDKLQNYKCNRCYIGLNDIYHVKSNFCIRCGTPRENLENMCNNCGLNFNQ